jgi:hypothetical protein
LSDIDPTDHALATIASLLEHPEPALEAEKPADIKPADLEHAVVADEPSLAPEPADADGYTKVGPGPMEAIRFRWTVCRGEDGRYYVHETIGEHSAAVVNGPMSSEDAVRLVDERESEAHHRFEILRSEISGRGVVAEFVRKGRSET